MLKNHNILKTKENNPRRKRAVFLSDEDWDFIEHESQSIKGRHKKAALFHKVIEFYREQIIPDV